MKKTLSLGFAALMLFAACDKEETVAPTVTKIGLLTDKNWKYFDSGIDSNNDGQIDTGSNGFFEPDSCDADDFRIFRTNGVVDFKENSVKCDPSDADSQGTWKFYNNESSIITTYSDGTPSDTAKIETLDNTMLSVSTALGGTRAILVFKH
jgi:hypothetical protein